MVTRDTTHLAGGLPAEPVDRPAPQRPGPVRGVLAFLRNIWRQLTSMRTALVLLFLLALASLPGALLPQWSLNTSKTAQYIVDHGAFGKLLDRLGFFGVFGSPWYAAIYLLLFTSLVGCLLPRTWDFVGQIRMKPVATPRNLARMPHSASVAAAGSDPAAVAERISAGLRGWRKVTRSETSGGGTGSGRSVVTVSAEKGYLREVGNLIFHFSLLGLLVAIALGKLFGFEGSVIINADDGPSSQFCSSSPSNYDNFRPGLLVDGTELNPFCVSIDKFAATYTSTGQASSFVASIRYQSGAQLGSDTWTSRALEVNDPLRIQGQRLYLLGHGYSPVFTVTYPDGSTQTGTEPFQPKDAAFTSEGAVKFLDPPGYTGSAVLQHQLAVVGIFAPSAVLDSQQIMTSNFPAPQTPGVAIQVYRGDMGMESGQAQSIFSIDADQVASGKLVKLNRANLAPGESMKLDDGSTVTFTGYKQWVSLQTSYDPAQGWALVFAISLLIGLMVSLTIKRRRVWFRVSGPAAAAAGVVADGSGAGAGVADPVPPDAPLSVPRRTVESDDRVTVDIGGLARTDQAGYGEEFTKLVALAGAGDASLEQP